MKLYNTLTRQVEELQPLEPNKVSIYTCGLTVYNQPHLGNWLGYIYWDVLVRTLQQAGYAVNRTQNITDVGHLTSDDDNGEDKMEKGAKREGSTAWDVAEKYINIATKEAASLNLLPPDHLVRATETIDQQIAFARLLDEKGYLYPIDGDGMYFDTAKLLSYGSLARLDIDGLEAGARVSVEGKRNITDFAVWKFSPIGVKRDMEWDSPWGKGFPGWHLECSVIARETLGDQIDIHTGGIDHIPVHHVNEIAQTEAITNKQFSQFWLHVNHIKSDSQKMSKSLGNIYTLGDLKAKGFSPDDFRVFALGKHYRTEGNFTWDNLEAAANRLQNWREIAALVWQTNAQPDQKDKAEIAVFRNQIVSALNNDLNTPRTLRIIDKTLDLFATGKLSVPTFTVILHMIRNFTGIAIAVPDIPEATRQLVSDREHARLSKDWASSDKLRDTLKDLGIGLRDTPTGTIWYYLA